MRLDELSSEEETNGARIGGKSLARRCDYPLKGGKKSRVPEPVAISRTFYVPYCSGFVSLGFANRARGRILPLSTRR
jgi:hypothetical protein